MSFLVMINYLCLKNKFQTEASLKQAGFNRRMRQQELQKLQDDVLKDHT